MQVLFAWLGQADLNGAGLGDYPAVTPGPIARAVEVRDFDDVLVLSDYDESRSARYSEYLAGRSRGAVTVEPRTLSDPTAFDEIYRAAEGVVGAWRKRLGPKAAFTYHLSPGTPAMAVVWIVLANSKHPASLLETSRQAGVRDVHFPFEMAAEFAPLAAASDDTLIALAEARAPVHPRFKDIVGDSPALRDVLWRAEQLAARTIPVLIEGESGTGKELLARAIHEAGPRHNRPLVAVNCGAIPAALLESELFGHAAGAFTGAVRSHRGCFERADKSTLFLDELGELPLDAQVRLLRVLQEREVTPLGSEKSRAVDVRVIAATNRSLAADVQAGRFREDLFHRIGVGVLLVPPIRARHGDLTRLIDASLRLVNQELEAPGYVVRTLDIGARRVLLSHHWPGNVRELQNVLLRAALWSRRPAITTADVRSAMSHAGSADNHVLNRALGDGFRLDDVVGEVYRHYLTRAFAEGETKAAATKLLGLSNYQTFSNLCRKYRISKGAKTARSTKASSRD